MRQTTASAGEGKGHSPADRDLGLDALRAISIWAVISLLHAVGYVERGAGVRIDFGTGVQTAITALSLGVVTIVSGFVIARRYPSLTSSDQLRSFAMRRVVRLYPLYTVALIVFWVSWYPDQGLPWALAQLSCLGVLISGFGLPVVATIYYVQIVMICYALYGVAMHVKGRARTGVILASGIILLAWCGVLQYGNIRVLLYVPLFAVGAAWALRESGRSASVLTLGVQAIVAILAVGVLVVPRSHELPLLLASLVATALAASAFHPLLLLARRVAQYAPRTIGELAHGSFVAFLFHRPVLSIIDRAISVSGVWANVALFCVLGTAVSFLLGMVVQRLYDALVRSSGVLRSV